MSGSAAGEEACVYVISSRRVDLVKIGVAADARKRLRELQVGSPVELELADSRRYGDRRDALAVAEELYRHFAARRVRGSWYRLTLAEVREGFSRRSTVEAPARGRADAEAQVAAPDERAAPRRRRRRPKRTEKQLAYERRRRQTRTAKQRQAATLLTQMNQEQAAAAIGVTSRTLRNWKTAPAFRHERERQRKQAARPRRPRS